MAVAALAAVVTATGAFAVFVDHPGRMLSSRWHTFQHSPGRDTSSTHLFTLGSNRYDFWVVAAREWRSNPIAGAGSGAFAVDYLEHGHSYETPARPHSLPLELLGEGGIVAFLIGALTLGAILVGLGRGARRRRAPALAAFAAATGWLAQACVDWTWTFPAVSIPLFVLCGIGLAADGTRELTRRAALSVAAGAVVVGALWFVPPWLASRLTERGIATRSAADLTWAHRLDPVSTTPWIAQAEIAPTPAAALVPLEHALRREPRSLGVRFILGSTLYNAGRYVEAERQFQAALALHPGDAAVTRALEVVRGRLQ